MLVRTSKRIAGFPPPGVVGEVDDERATAAIERGDAEDMSSLSARLRRKPESPDPFAFEMEDDLKANPGGWSDSDADPFGDVRATATALTEREAEHPNDGS